VNLQQTEKLLRNWPTQYNLEWLGQIGKRTDIVSVFTGLLFEITFESTSSETEEYTHHITLTGLHPSELPVIIQILRSFLELNTDTTLESALQSIKAPYFLHLTLVAPRLKSSGLLCRDPKLLQAIHEGKDFHSFSASAMYGIPYNEFIMLLKIRLTRITNALRK
jgi:hypothetical protein